MLRLVDGNSLRPACAYLAPPFLPRDDHGAIPSRQTPGRRDGSAPSALYCRTPGCIRRRMRNNCRRLTCGRRSGMGGLASAAVRYHRTREGGVQRERTSGMILFEWILVLLFAAVVLTAAADRLRVPYPSLLAIAGAGIAFLPFAPDIRIEPDLALALFVAPALLDAAFDTSPQELRRNVIPVVSLAVFAVVLTTAAVAFVGWRFAGLPTAAAIALGAIVAPPDAAAANEVLRHLRIPQRIGLVLQGESLLNDATALLIYRAAVAAAVGSFSLVDDAPILLLAAFGSLVAGYLLARLYLIATSYVRDAAGSTVLQFMSTFGVWLLSERLTLS